MAGLTVVACLILSLFHVGFGQVDLRDIDILRRFPGNCSKGMFDCGEKCITAEQFRDCTQDCASGIDESCWAGSTKCDGCRCVDPKDVNRLCLEKNQANNKLCTITGRYICSNQQCVLKEWMADGRNDCGDWSDENPCLNGINPCPNSPGVVCRFVKPNGFQCACSSPTDTYNGVTCVPVTVPPTTPPPTSTPVPTFNPPIPRKCNLTQLTNVLKPVQSSLGIVFNTKLSMNSERNFLSAGVMETWFSTTLNEPKIKNFVLLPYGPNVGDVVRTTSIQQVYEAIQQLSGTSRIDCSDPAMGAILAAVQSVEPNSDIIVVTDGAARDYSTVDAVLAGALNKTARISFIVSGTCPVNQTVNDAFTKLAAATGGEVFRVDKSASDFNSILQYTRRYFKQNFTVVDMARFTDRGSIVVPTDVGMEEMVISATGTGVLLQTNATNSYTYLVRLANVKVISFQTPIAENINITVSGTGPVTVRVWAVGQPSITVVLSPNPLLANPSMGGQIIFGSPVQAVISPTAGTASRGFPLNAVIVKEVESGSVLYQGPLKLNRTDSTGRESYVSGKFFPTCKPFMIEVLGTNDCNERIQRAASGVFQAVQADYTSQVPGTCPQGQLDCGSGGGCIPVNAIRDYKADCPSGIDEARTMDDYNCNSNCTTCTGATNWCNKPNVLRCSNGNCVPNSWMNDGFDDCGDGTDEKPQTTTTTMSTSTTTTRPATTVTAATAATAAVTTPSTPAMTTTRDTYPVTLDPAPNLSTDEVYRRIYNNSCNRPPGRFFQCSDGACIPVEKFRDCAFNCRDGSDEVCPTGLTKCSGSCKCAAQNTSTCADAQIREICSRSTMYPCRTTDYCARTVDLLNGIQNCADNSDEDPSYLDECYLGLAHCDTHSYCRNIPSGTYECVCVFGFQGNGTYCDRPHNVIRRR